MKTKSYLSIVAGLLLISCSESVTNKTESDISKPAAQVENLTVIDRIAQDVPADEFKSFIANGTYQLVDVRTPEEFAEGTIENAVNIDFLGDTFADEISRLDPTVPVLVFCRSGGRSSQAMQQFSEAGFNEVYNLLGGYSDWPKK